MRHLDEIPRMQVCCFRQSIRLACATNQKDKLMQRSYFLVARYRSGLRACYSLVFDPDNGDAMLCMPFIVLINAHINLGL